MVTLSSKYVFIEVFLAMMWATDVMVTMVQITVSVTVTRRVNSYHATDKSKCL